MVAYAFSDGFAGRGRERVQQRAGAFQSPRALLVYRYPLRNDRCCCSSSSRRLPTLALAQVHQPSASHSDPVTPVVIALAIILAAAKLGGHLAAQVGQPAVLGELVAGVVLGNLDLAGISWFGSIERIRRSISSRG